MCSAGIWVSSIAGTSDEKANIIIRAHVTSWQTSHKIKRQIGKLTAYLNCFKQVTLHLPQLRILGPSYYRLLALIISACLMMEEMGRDAGSVTGRRVWSDYRAQHPPIPRTLFRWVFAGQAIREAVTFLLFKCCWNASQYSGMNKISQDDFPLGISLTFPLQRSSHCETLEHQSALW